MLAESVLRARDLRHSVVHIGCRSWFWRPEVPSFTNNELQTILTFAVEGIRENIENSHKRKTPLDA